MTFTCSQSILLGDFGLKRDFGQKRFLCIVEDHVGLQMVFEVVGWQRWRTEHKCRPGRRPQFCRPFRNFFYLGRKKCQDVLF